MSKIIKCSEHNNQVQTICSYKDCRDRGLCLLCSHLHVFLPTIKQSIPINYNKFVKKLNLSIDNILSSTLQKDKQLLYNTQITQINKYFQQAQQFILKLFHEKKLTVLKLLQQNTDQVPKTLRKYRIDCEYLKAKEQDWKLLNSLYQGNQIQQYYLQKNQQVYKQIQAQLQNIQESTHILQQKLKIKMSKSFNLEPSIIFKIDLNHKLIDKESNNKNNNNKINYEKEYQKNDTKHYNNRILLQTSKFNYDSIISDGLLLNDLLYTTSYDKNLRVCSLDMILLKQHEFNNTLEGLISLSNNQMVVGVSKQLAVLQLTDDTHEIKEIMRLRGHDEKVKSIDNMNKRIIASAGGDCVYIWDLFKDNVKYAIRDKVAPSVVGFVKNAKKVIVGYSDWNAKIFDVQTLKRIRTLQLGGIPLSSLKIDQNTHYLSGFPNTLSLVDLRSSKPIKQQIGSQAITCMSYNNNSMIVGNRQSKILIYNLKSNKTMIEWEAHNGMTTWDKPNGIANLHILDNKLFSFGVNDKLIKKWQLL